MHVSVCGGSLRRAQQQRLTCPVNSEISSTLLGSQRVGGKIFQSNSIISTSNNKILFHAVFYNFGGFSSIYKLFTHSSCTKPDFYDSNSKEIHISLTALHTFFSILVNNHKTKAQTKLLLIPGLVSLFQNLKIT